MDNQAYQNSLSLRGGGFELENYILGDGGRFLVSILFLCSLAGLILLGLWVFYYGETTQDITGKVKDTYKRLDILIPGAVLTAISSIILPIVFIRFHNESEKQV